MQNTGVNQERDLLEQIAGGDQQAFAVLFDQYHHLLGHHIYKITENRELTQEIVQDVFLKIWMTREALREIEHFKAWIYKVASNQSINAVKKIARQRVRQQQWEQYARLEEEEEEDQRLPDIIDAAIAGLPAQQQKVYLLSRREGLRYQDIAREMGLSQETVKYYMKLALAGITRHIKAELGITALLLFFPHL